MNWILHTTTIVGFLIAYLWWKNEGGYEPLLACLAGFASIFAILKDKIHRNKEISEEFTHKFPINFDDKKDTVRKVLGEPQESSWLIDTFYSEGVAISYDQHFDTVDGFVFALLKSGTTYKGSIFGIKIGDDFITVKEKLKNPIDWGIPHEELSVAIWEIKKNLLIVFFWRSIPKSSTHYKDVKIGTVKMIAYCKKKSFFAYESMVIASIEQIKKGKPPKYLEDNALLDVNFEEDFFQEDYEILGVHPGLMGGAIITVVFTESEKTLYFWVYPLQWKFPVIRSITVSKNEKGRGDD